MLQISLERNAFLKSSSSEKWTEPTNVKSLRGGRKKQTNPHYWAFHLVQIQHIKIIPYLSCFHLLNSVVQNIVILVCPYAIKGAMKVQIIKTLTQAGKCTLQKGQILFKRQQFDKITKS